MVNPFKKIIDHLIEVGRQAEAPRDQAAPPAAEVFEMPAAQRARMGRLQAQTFYTIAGKPWVRVPLPGDAAQRCQGCGAKPGEMHIPTCPRETCPACGGTAFQCDCHYGA